MTTEQAITMLSARYGQITTVKDDVFAARDGHNFELFRLEDGRLERRFDVDEHTCIWEVVG